MKKTSFFVICILIISVFVCTPSFSATIDDLVGTWLTSSKAKLSFSGVGSFSDENPSISVLDSNYTFTLTEDNETGIYYYTGTFELIDGKNLSFRLDQDGEEELIRTWKDWAEEIAYRKGASTITGIIFTYDTLTISQPSISKKTLIPKKTKINAKGWASATIDGKYMLKRFSYKSTVTFLGRQ